MFTLSKYSKCDQIRRKLKILSHFLKKSLMENFSFCAMPISNEDIFFQKRMHQISMRFRMMNNCWLVNHRNQESLLLGNKFKLHNMNE